MAGDKRNTRPLGRVATPKFLRMGRYDQKDAPIGFPFDLTAHSVTIPLAVGESFMTAAVSSPPASEPREALIHESEAGVEFVNGQIVEKPVSIESSKVEMEVAFLLKAEAKRSGTMEVFGSSMGYRCYRDDPKMYRKPDVSVIRAERLAGIDPQEGFMPIPADLVVEVISPNDLHDDVVDKVDEYLKNGFGIVWVVNPPTRTVHVYRRDGSISLLHEADEISGESALPGFKCRVADFFAGRSAATPSPT